MSVSEQTIFAVHCNGDGCDTAITGLPHQGFQNLRRALAKAGWKVGIQRGLLNEDFCPRHRAEAGEPA